MTIIALAFSPPIPQSVQICMRPMRLSEEICSLRPLQHVPFSPSHGSPLHLTPRANLNILPHELFSRKAELTGSDTQYLSSLGYAVAVSGNTVVVSSPGGSDGQGNFASGAVYVYVKPASGWGNMTQVAKPTPSDQTAVDSFGTSVAISGNTIVANSNNPEVYVYEEPSTGWTDMTETAILSAPSVANAPCLCGQVGISGNTIIVGSPLDTQNYGSIEVYSKPAAGWQSSSSPNAVLMQPAPVVEDQSFRSVAIDGKVVVGEG